MKASKYLMITILTLVGLVISNPTLLLSQTEKIDSAFSDTQITDDYNKQIDSKKISCLYENSVGIRFSNFSGYGLNFTRRIANSYAIAISGIGQLYEYQQWSNPSKNKLITDRRDINLNIGIELQVDLVQSQNTRIYTLLGGGYVNEDNHDLNGGKNTYTQSVGLGFGLDWYVHKRISGFISLAYIYHKIDNDVKDYPDVEKETTIGFGVGMSFHF